MIVVNAMRRCDGGPLLDSLSRRTYTEYEVREYMRQLLMSLDYLHTKGIAHLGINVWTTIFSS